jgi:RHS repeat-associated protein
MPRLKASLTVLISILLLPCAVEADYLAETRQIVWSDAAEPALLQKATELGSAPAVYEYVRNSFEFAPYYGARSNATNTFLSKRGNDVDLATVLISMLRSQEIPARYAEGYVQVASDDVANWVQIENPDRAAGVLLESGFKNVASAQGVTEFTHTWVQALVHLTTYRGSGPDAQVDCEAQPSECVWVDLDPSFKLHRFRDASEIVDISEAVLFDYEAYYRADDPEYQPADGIDRHEKGVLEIYEEQILQYLRSTPGLAGKTLEDVIYHGEVIREEHGVLPTSLPYLAIGVESYESVDAHDLVVDPPPFNNPGQRWGRTLTFTVTFPEQPELAALSLTSVNPVFLSDLSTQRLTLSWESEDFGSPSVPQQLVAHLPGEIQEVLFSLTGSTYTASDGSFGTLSNPPGSGSPFSVALVMDPGDPNEFKVEFHSRPLGGVYVIAAGGETSNRSQVDRSARKLLQALDDHPVVQDPQGVVYVDANANGTIDSGERMLLEDSQARIALTAGVLALEGDLQFARLLEDVRRMSAYHRVTLGPPRYLALVNAVENVSLLEGTAFSITPAGLLIDMTALANVPMRIDQPSAVFPRSARLAGHILSALEHETWRALTGLETMSTMKGIQRTVRDGADLLFLDSTQPQAELADALASFGFGPMLPAGFTSEDIEIFGLNLWVVSRNSPPITTLEVLAETVDANTPQFRLFSQALPVGVEGGQTYLGAHYSRVFLEEREWLQARLDAGYSTNPFAYRECPDPAGFVTNKYALLLHQLEPCWDQLLTIDDDIRTFAEYFDQNHPTSPFDPQDHRYRVFDPETEKHISLSTVTGIHLGISLWDEGLGTLEFVVPSELARTELHDFEVYLDRSIDLAGVDSSAVYAINVAGGGWVSSQLPFDPNDPLGLGYNHELFNDFLLTSSLYNSEFTLSTLDPIATVSGNMYHDETDLIIKSRGGLDFVFTRTYNSSPSRNGSESPLGSGWTHSYNMRLISGDHGKNPGSSDPENSDGSVSSVTYVDERGGEHLFGVSGTGSMSGWAVSNPRGSFDTLDLSDADSEIYTLEFRNGTQYVFGAADLSVPGRTARLLFIRDPYGHELAFGYEGNRLANVTDGLGRALTLTYESGRLNTLEDWTERVWTYGYGPFGRQLETVENPLHEVTTYRYEPSAGVQFSEPLMIDDSATYLVVAADLDGDKDLDVLASSTNQTIAWYENDGSGGFAVQPAIYTGSVGGAVDSVVAADLDGDGDLDVLFGSYSLGTGWYQNDGSGGFAAQPAIATAIRSTDVFAADLDGDGDLDVLSTSSLDDTIVWYENDGTGDFTAQPVIATAEDRITSIFAADLDGDGDLDVLCASAADDRVTWYENDGAGGFTSQLAISTMPNAGAGSVFAADLDGDGDLDVLSFLYSATSQAIAWFENDGTGGFTARSAISTPSSSALQVIAADLDNDGDLDVLSPFFHAPYHADKIAWYQNDGTGEFAHQPAISAEPDGHSHSVFAADLDGDGDLDVLSSKYQFAPKIAWYPSSFRGRSLVEIVKPEDRDEDGEGDVRTIFDYYENGRAFSNANSFGAGEQLDYDLFTKRTRISDPRGFATFHSYDENGELTKLSQPDGGILTFRHDEDGRRFEKTNALGYNTSYSYCTDRVLGDCAEGTSAHGNVTLEQDALGATVEYDYRVDHHDQIARVKDKDGGVIVSLFYEPEDSSEGSVEGKLKRTQIETLTTGIPAVTLSDVPLMDYRYYPDGSLWQQIEYLAPGNLSRYRTTTLTYKDGNGVDVEEILVTGTDGSDPIRRTFTYDELGRVESETLQRRADPTAPTTIPLTTIWEYDDLDRPFRVTNPDGDERVTSYDANGNVTQVLMRYTRAGGYDEVIVERRKYDAADRLVELQAYDAPAAVFEYDAAGNLTRTTDPTGAWKAVEYDAMNRPTATRDENGHLSKAAYDLAGQLIRTVDPNGNETAMAYDAVGNLKTLTVDPDSLALETRFEYYPSGRLKKTTNANALVDLGLRNSYDASEYREYDQLGRLTLVTDAQNGETRFAYDLLGNQTEVLDANGQSTTLAYDDLGRLASTTDASGLPEFVFFDEAGNLIKRIDRELQETHYRYDSLNRLQQVARIGSGFADVLQYDDRGNLESISNPEVTYSFSYDARDRLTSKADSRLGRTLQYTSYDDANRLLEKVDYQGEATRFQYDRTGRLIAEENPAYLQVSYHYDPAGRLLDRILSSGVRTRYAYDDANRLTGLTQRTAGGTVVSSLTYGYDPVGNIMSIDDGSGPVPRGYDALHRLTSVATPGHQDYLAYSYDPVGNRLTETANAGVRHFVSGPANRLQEIRQTNAQGALLASFEYDDNGAVVERKDGQQNVVYALTRNDRGQVEAMSGPGGTVQLGYDPQGYRVRRTDASGVHAYHLEGEHMEAIYDGAGALEAKYLRGTVIDEVVAAFYVDGAGKETAYQYHHDALQSVLALSGHAGTVEETLTYAPFGQATGQTGTSPSRLRYTGREQDPETGLYYYRARYYDPDLGRFLSPDPLGFGGGDVNLYAYVGNNPLNANDPTGNCPSCIGAATSVAFGYGISLFTGQEYTFADAAADAALGAVGAGLISKGAKLWQLRNVPLSTVTKLRAGAGTNALNSIDEGVYLIRGGGNAYVGQSGQIATRTSAHVAKGFSPQQTQNAVRLEVLGGRTAREIAEQRALTGLGGPDAVGVLNKLNPIGGRPHLGLGGPIDDFVSGAAVPGLSNAVYSGTGAASGVLHNVHAKP